MDPTSSYYANTPTADLHSNERVIAEFHPNRDTYWRANAWLAAIAMAVGMGILWIIGNPYIWTGAIGGLFAIAVRAFYLASDELKQRWDLTDQRLLGPGGRIIALHDIAQTRTLMSMVQIITTSGEKHLIKNQSDTDAVIAEIEDAKARHMGS